ncbi:39S ribosomal protein L33, mitochondrial isoform X2 [Artibeus jamaicensis]|uniref:39S ribosomal protein L33, mitochondrial isoform X2 n=1 Tax=Artibeus jamaicensis TaxID=9417 RepID=UPI00235A9C91|nr:39S ribosomal protein L33, mitochondrial isoform X2 [Artibeus jamaicensis]
MFLSVVSFAKSKSKNILVRMVSQAGTGYSFNAKRSRLGEKLTLLHYDPFGPSVVRVAFKALMPCCLSHLLLPLLCTRGSRTLPALLGTPHCLTLWT